MEQLSASLGDRKADLLIKMNPPIVTTETIQEQSQKPTVQFRLFDSATDSNFKEVTYFITIEKDGETLLSDWFFNPNGNLTIQMQPRNQSDISVYGQLDPILNAYTSREGNPVVAAGPIFLEGGLYHFTVRIVTVDFARTILPADQQPEFDSWLSIGAAKNANLTVNGEKLPVKVLSYYDEVGNITYDQSANSINFTMPFNYDLERLNDPKNTVFVHQEIEVPVPSPLSQAGGYLGYANGNDVTNTLMVDGNNQTKDVVHFMMTKPVVLQIAKEYVNSTVSENKTKGWMTFSLVPSKNGSIPMGGPMNMDLNSEMNMSSDKNQ
ncbi:MAG TPA: hypothetical protein VFG45_07590 [Candidatus Nitrosocosmicus sp.]|nr:hypothetical protein [Candidatus Nitrosocosmicus sp.]